MLSSSSSARISSSFRMTVPLALPPGVMPPRMAFLPPMLRVMMLTVSRFVPIEEIDSVTDAVVPWPMATSTITLMTPMITPSIVRNERTLLPEMALKAMEIVWKSCIRSPPRLPRRARAPCRRGYGWPGASAPRSSRRA